MLISGKGELKIDESNGNFKVNIDHKLRLSLYNNTWKSSGSDWIVTFKNGSNFVKIRLRSSDPDSIEVIVESLSDGLNELWLRLAAETAEEIYGGGEQFSYVNLRGRGAGDKNVFPIWISEQGVNRKKFGFQNGFFEIVKKMATGLRDTAVLGQGDYYTTYFAQPTFVSSRNYFFHHTGTNYAVLNFTNEDFHEVFVYGKPDKFVITMSDSLVKTVKSLTKYLGNMPELPDWIQEKIIVSVQGGTKNLVEKENLTKVNGLPISGIWIQDWSGKIGPNMNARVNWNWEWDKTLYPNLDNIIQDWKRKGVYILGYINPNLRNNGKMFKEAELKGYLVKNKTGGVYKRSSLNIQFGQVDLTNPEAFKWYKNVIKTNMIDLGLGGWMADYGEYLAVDSVLHDGRTGLEAHNEWPVLWAKLNREAVEESGKLGEVVFFTRSGFTGTSKYSLLLWNGDQNVDFSLDDGVRSTIYGSIGAGINGMTFSHFDVGGYTTVAVARFGMARTRELLIRSAEYAVFTSVFRCHEGNGISNNEQWYDVNNIADFAVLAQNFQKLSGYRKAVGKESVNEGLPTMRLTSLVFPNDSQPVSYDQYMFGSDLLVAPVYLEGSTKRSVTFPKLPNGDQWIHIWSGKKVNGNQIMEVRAPLGQPAVYYRSSSAFKKTFESFRNG